MMMLKEQILGTLTLNYSCFVSFKETGEFGMVA